MINPKSCLLAIMLIVATQAFGQKNKTSLVHWTKFELLDSLMEVAPKKVLINIYTNWCGFCKSMDKDVYRNISAANFINEQYYAINFDAEQKSNIVFNGTEYFARKKYENIITHELAMHFLNGMISYPAVVILNEKKKVIAVEQGYQHLFQMEGMLKYFVSDSYLKEHYNDYIKKLVYAWEPNRK